MKRDNRFIKEGIDIGKENLTETIDVITSHACVREFEERDVSLEAIKAIVTAAQSAPTSSNLQSYSIIVIKDSAKRKELAKLCGNQEFISEAPVFLVFAPDLYRHQHVAHRSGQTYHANSLEMFLVAVTDAALAMENALVAAESLGLGVVPVGGVRNEPEEVARLLELPEGVFALVGLAIGYPRENPEVKYRLKQEVVVHHERYSTTNLDLALDDYEEKIPGWSERVANRVANPRQGRRHLRASLERIGFDFD